MITSPRVGHCAARLPSFRSSTACLLALPNFGLGAKQSAASRLVGTWRYDIQSVKIVTDPKLLEAMRRDPKTASQAPALIAKAKAQILKLIAPIRFGFKANGRVVVSSIRDATKKMGKWRLNALRIQVTMDDPKQQTPKMELNPTGRRITVSYFGAGFGTMNAAMIPA